MKKILKVLGVASLLFSVAVFITVVIKMAIEVFPISALIIVFILVFICAWALVN